MQCLKALTKISIPSIQTILVKTIFSRGGERLERFEEAMRFTSRYPLCGETFSEYDNYRVSWRGVRASTPDQTILMHACGPFSRYYYHHATPVCVCVCVSTRVIMCDPSISHRQVNGALPRVTRAEEHRSGKNYLHQIGSARRTRSTVTNAAYNNNRPSVNKSVSCLRYSPFPCTSLSIFVFNKLANLTSFTNSSSSS